MIALNMIVKNEAHVIARCLRSVLPLIDQAVIVDTGSTDNTIAIITEELRSIDHVILQRPWENFGRNRTQAFEAAQAKLDPSGYALLMDADEEMKIEKGFKWPKLGKPVAGIWNATPRGGLYLRPQLLGLKYDFYWEGVLHEQLRCRDKIDGVVLEGLHCVGHFDSKRNQNPRKYLEDAQMLAKEPANSHNLFYLAQSYRDAGELTLAKVTYRQRITLGGDEEQVWYSMYMVACLMQTLGQYDDSSVAGAYNKAYLFRRSRAEPLRALAEFWLSKGNTSQHRIIHEMADMIPYPKQDKLFIDPSAYTTRFPQASRRAAFSQS